MDERTWNERVAASLEQMRRECAADRHQAELKPERFTSRRPAISREVPVPTGQSHLGCRY
jgi:hypothetical protein